MAWEKLTSEEKQGYANVPTKASKALTASLPPQEKDTGTGTELTQVVAEQVVAPLAEVEVEEDKNVFTQDLLKYGPRQRKPVDRQAIGKVISGFQAKTPKTKARTFD